MVDQMPPGPAASGNKMAVVAVVLAVLGVLFGVTIWLFPLAFVCGVPALILGVIARRRSTARRALATGAAVVGALLVIYSLTLGWIVADAFCVFSTDPTGDQCDNY